MDLILTQKDNVLEKYVFESLSLLKKKPGKHSDFHVLMVELQLQPTEGDNDRFKQYIRENGLALITENSIGFEVQLTDRGLVWLKEKRS